MKNKQLAGAILLALGLAVATGAVENYWQAPVAVAMLLVGGAWIQGLTVREFVRRILSADEPSKYDSIKHKTGRNYGQAAIFVGTACLFMGTPKECKELCDDLWHRGIHAEVTEVTEGMEFNIL